MIFRWERYGGYEVSTAGDARFSAFNARLSDGRSIEQHYQCDVKGYDPKGRNWRLGKGKPSLRDVNLWEEYLSLWLTWAKDNEQLLQILEELVSAHEYTLSDKFATTEMNQAHALATILNDRQHMIIR